MCVIIHKPENCQIDLDILDDCYFHNPDGFGLTYLDRKSGKLIVKRGMCSRSKIKRVFQKYNQESEGAEMLLHFRYATHGHVDKDNCHPFRGQLYTPTEPNFGQHFTLVHNGVIHSLQPRYEHWSDTRELVALLTTCGYQTKAEVAEVLETFAFGNRFAVLYDCGHVAKFGKWSTYAGLHFSNLNWQWRQKYKTETKSNHRKNVVAWNVAYDHDYLDSLWDDCCNRDCF